MKMSQLLQIKQHLEQGESLTQRDAIALFNCYRLGARIKDLRDTGMAIKTVMEKNKGHGSHARYLLEV